MTDATLATPAVAASDTIKTIGILHFTIGVRDHIAAAKFYSEVLGCKHMRSNERYSFMECGGSYFVLAKIPHYVNPNRPGEDAHHHAFLVAPQEFGRALAIMKARGIELVKYFRGRAHHVPRPSRLFPRRRWQRHRDHRSLQEIGRCRRRQAGEKRHAPRPIPSAPPPRGSATARVG